MKKLFIPFLLALFLPGCSHKASRDQCSKACFNQVALVESQRTPIDWDGKIERLNKELQDKLQRLQQQQKQQLEQLKQALQAKNHVAGKDVPVEQNKAYKALQEKQLKQLKALKSLYERKINDVKTEKLKTELKTKKRVTKEINNCVKECLANKWQVKHTTCVAAAKSIQQIKACF